MAERRIILEMGSGNDLYGGDYTKAACRAVQEYLGIRKALMVKYAAEPHEFLFVNNRLKK